MKYCLQHYTAYSYSKPVSQCHNELRMIPFSNHLQTISNCEVKIHPKPDVYFERIDYFGNRVASFNIHRSHSQLIVHSTVEVETNSISISKDHPANLPWESIRDTLASYCSVNTPPIKEFLYPSELIPKATPDIQAYALRFFTPNKDIVSALSSLTSAIFTEFTYKPGFTDVSTPISKIMMHKKGVCQDFAHFAIACARSIGLAARYVSGYLETLPPPGKEKLIGADASHAWFSVYIPNIGWVDFDPTNNQQINNQYITLAYGRDYADVTPLKGVVYGGGSHTLEVRVDVRPSSEKIVDLNAHNRRGDDRQ
jgi:transglutaminase-like putative cysteine protease